MNPMKLKLMLKLSSVVSCGIISLGLLFIAREPTAFADQTLNAVIASVNGKAITLLDLEARVKPHRKISLADVTSDSSIRTLLDQMITENLIEEEGKQRQLTVNQSDIDGYINEIASQNSLSVDEFKRELQREKIDFDEYKTKVRLDIMKSKIASVVFREGAPVSNEEIDSFIKQNSELGKTGEKVKLRQILISSKSRSVKEITTLTEEIESKIKEGTEFSELANQYSDSPDAHDGGLIGVVVLSELNPMIQDSILLLGEGETSEAVTTERGTYFFHVDEKLTGTTVAIKDDVRRMIENQKLQEKLSKYFALDIYKKHSVEKKV